MTVPAPADLGPDVLGIVDGDARDPACFRVGGLRASLRFAAGAHGAGARPVVVREGRGIPGPARAELEGLVARAVPVVVVFDRGLTRGALAALLDIDGLAVAVPASPDAVGAVVRACVTETRLACVVVSDAASTAGDASAAAAVTRTGSDLTLFAAGAAVAAAHALAERTAGASLEVVDLCWLSPLDVGVVRDSVRRTGRALIIEDRPDSWGGRVALAVGEACFGDLDAPVRCAAALDQAALDGKVAALLAW